MCRRVYNTLHSICFHILGHKNAYCLLPIEVVHGLATVHGIFPGGSGSGSLCLPAILQPPALPHRAANTWDPGEVWFGESPVSRDEIVQGRGENIWKNNEGLTHVALEINANIHSAKTKKKRQLSDPDGQSKWWNSLCASRKLLPGETPGQGCREALCCVSSRQEEIIHPHMNTASSACIRSGPRSCCGCPGNSLR